MKPIFDSSHCPDDASFLEFVKSWNRETIGMGVEFGWWESVDKRGNPVPFPIRVPMTELPENPFVSHLMVHVGIFDSVSEAKKNGGNKRLTIGEHIFKRNKRGPLRVIVE